MNMIIATNFDLDTQAQAFAECVALLAKHGIQYEVLTETKAPAVADKPVATKKPTVKAPAKPVRKATSKKSDDFDREAYESIAKRLGCLGAHGVWKPCRQFVYGVMDGSLTEAQAKRKVADFAKKQGWELCK